MSSIFDKSDNVSTTGTHYSDSTTYSTGDLIAVDQNGYFTNSPTYTLVGGSNSTSTTMGGCVGFVNNVVYLQGSYFREDISFDTIL